MSAGELHLDRDAVAARLRSDADQVGIFEVIVGLNTATTALKSVHLMNDLAQQVLGGAPKHRGDFICRVIRHKKEGEEGGGEDNSDAALRADERFGADYRQAFPATLGAAKTRAIREAANLLLNTDGGMYRAGDGMASGLASHWTLLGFEGFSRLGLGAALAHVLGDEGRAQVKQLFESATDPVSRALRPLMLGGELVPRVSGRASMRLTPFDKQYGACIANMLQHSLSKPAKLRMLALAGVAWAVLRVLGAGRPEGRPAILAIPSQWKAEKVKLRKPAVQTFALGVSALDAAVAGALETDEVFQSLISSGARVEGESLAVSADEPAKAAIASLREARGAKVYWPDAFAIALGKRVGCIGPLSDRAGWGKYFCLTPDLLEVLVLMSVDPGGSARPWRDLWTDIRNRLGLVIGANPYEDERTLYAAGVQHVVLESLEHSSGVFLSQACRRGVARRLPDGEAEVGVGLY